MNMSNSKNNIIKSNSKPSYYTINDLFNKLNIKIYFAFSIGIILILIFVSYSNSYFCSFQFDDIPNIFNRNFPELSDLNGWWNFSKTRLIPFYTFALNIQLHGYEVWGFHLFNNVIHCINSVLVWWLSLLLFTIPSLAQLEISKYKKEIALIVALLFCTHPLATQSVTYIVQRMNSLAAMFFLLSVILYLKARLTNLKIVSRVLLFTLSFISALFAFHSKENSFTLPFVILLAETFLIGNAKSFIRSGNYLTLVVIAVMGCFFIWLIQRYTGEIFATIPPNEFHNTPLSPGVYAMTQIQVIPKYIQLLIFPVNQIVDYDFPLTTSLLNFKTILNVLFLIFLLTIAVIPQNPNRFIGFGILWIFITLSIESSFIPINDVIFEHRTYLPSFGFFLAITSGMYSLIRSRFNYLTLVLFFILISCYAGLTYQRNKIYKDEFTFWTDNIRKTPHKARPFASRAIAYDKIQNWEKSLKDYTKALELNPRYPLALSNRGIVWGHLNQWDKAIQDYTQALKLKPNYPEAYVNRGIAYSELKNWQPALFDLNKALELEPENDKAWLNRGNVHNQLKQWDQAINDYSQSIRINPDYANAYYNRGIIYNAIKEYDKALADYSKAIELLSGNHIYFYNKAIVFENMKNWENAIENHTQSIRLNPQHKESFIRRGYAYSQMGKWNEAIDNYKEALKTDPGFSIAHKFIEEANKNIKKK